MKKWIFSLAIMCTVSIQDAPQEAMTEQSLKKVPSSFLPSDNYYLSPKSINSGYLSVKGMQIQGFKGVSLQKLEAAFRVLERAVNSEEFKERVINFKNSEGERSFASNKGLTNEEIYQIFMEGRETLQEDTPGEMNFYLKLYHRPWSRVIGYTTGDTNVININWKFFRNYEPADVAANLAHEWTHKLGFGHRSARERDSAPYAIGSIVGDIASRMTENKLH